ncbi:MAG: hypothetical protein IJS29_10390, partial [Selenomonadaceae bacterium]|nr:hypothetical protein [Selenomonadaceae bacterium]
GEIIPLQVGKGDYSKGVVRENYENPTVIEFTNIEKFMAAYSEREGRPQTSWNDISISHDAQKDLDAIANSNLYVAFFEDLKRWCGDENFTAKAIDKSGYEIDLQPFVEILKDKFNPLEIYAYYLGSYINHMLQPNHIFMKYILSFPVTYERNIRERMLRSFTAGIKKSLPTALLSNEEVMKNFRVVEGTSEPAAYAVTALENFGFINGDDIEKIYYAVFDCGGGTTDFDFGMLRETGDGDSDAYDYILTHFGAAGDKTLGGEHLLKLLAFEIFKANIAELLKPKEKIPFTWAAEKLDFAGSEGIVRDSQEANLNMRALVRAIRPLWENPTSDVAKKILNAGVIELPNYFLGTGKESTGLKLSIGVQNFSFDEKNSAAEKVETPLVDVEKILADRIKRGVDNFFLALRDAFDKVSGGNDNGVDMLSDVKEIKIFLAGNSTKSALVKKIFDEYTNYETGKAREILGFGNEQAMPKFTLYPPLGTDDAKIIQLENGVEVDEKNFAAPTGKTGVAFGLLRCRDGQEIKVVDITPEGKDKKQVPFQFYVGRRSKKKFKVIIDKSTKLGEWYRFISADVDTFDLLYTAESIVATNDAPASIAKRLTIHIDADPTASVYVMASTSNTIRYAVSKDVPPPEVEGTPIILE